MCVSNSTSGHCWLKHDVGGGGGGGAVCPYRPSLGHHMALNEIIPIETRYMNPFYLITKMNMK